VPFWRTAVLLALRAVALSSLCFPYAAYSLSVPPDDESLLKGAENFERYCTTCHGWDPADQFTNYYGEVPEEERLIVELYAQLGESEEEEKKPAPAIEPEEDDWPEWAGPRPEKTLTEREALERAIVEDFSRAIDEVYGDETEIYGWDKPEDEYAFAEEYIEGREDEEIPSNENRRPDATDLLDPESYIFGTSGPEIYYSIAYGTGPTMSGFLEQVGGEEAVWDLVNYIQSLWVEESEDSDPDQ
jgi:mono/diheme cytochrome c family protein